MNSKLYVLLTLFALSSILLATSKADDDDDEDFVYTKGPFPKTFSRGQRYPDRDEDTECQPIRLRAARGSSMFQKLVTYTGNNVYFRNQNSRIMTSRLHSRFNTLANLYYQRYHVKLYVLKAWTEYEDLEVSERSLHYEGRSIRIHVTKNNVTKLFKIAVNDAGFDWVQYHEDGYAKLSVIPDVCDINVDLVFVTDQSGSVGWQNNRIALNFISNVIDFFTIGPNATQVGLVTYSTVAKVRFDLNDFHSKSHIQNIISNIGFPGGWTATALGLFQAGVFLNPSEQRGVRPTSEGVPRIVVLLTDGRSNIYPIDTVATSLHTAGVQVFTVGIGNIFLPELRFIASDPDRFHVFLLDSFNDASGFVDFMSFTACKAPAIVEPGENTTTEVPEDGFRFFQTECNAFSPSVIIEQIDIYGRCSLYASHVIANPGPLDDKSLVVRNEDRSRDRRSVVLKLTKIIKKVIYISIRGIDVSNLFSVIIWDRLFTKEHFLVYAREEEVNTQIFDLDQELTVVTERFSYSIKEGNEGGEFTIDPITGILTVVKPLFINVQQYFDLLIVAENINASCHRGRVKVTVIVVQKQLEFPDPPPAFVSEDAENGTDVTQVVAQGGNGVIQYSIVSGNIGRVFEIDEDNGEVIVVNSNGLDFETISRYELVIKAVSTPNPASATATLVINVLDVNEQPFFITLCAQQGQCMFEALENQTAGLIVDEILADDPDLANVDNGMLNYTISPSGLPFTIQNNGTLRADILDREVQDFYEFVVTVSDRGNPALSVQTNVSVRVLDINDNNPRITSGLPAFTLPEDFEPMAVTQYAAMDADIILRDLLFSLRSAQPNLPFEIINTTGVLVLVEPLDFDLGPRIYMFDVVVTDGGGLTGSFSVVVRVSDVNDNFPQFSQSAYEADIEENSLIGTFVVQTEATDLDSGVNGLISYSILSGNMDNLFRINSSTGEIFVNANIDREVVPMVELIVEARDIELTNLTNVTITVLDVNDNAPMFADDEVTLTVPEDEPVGPLMITLTAVDIDQPGTPNSAILYSIEQGNQDGFFTINTGTGSLSLVRPLDFETNQSFVLIVVASDQGVPVMRDNLTVTINILNVNDNAPVVSGNQDIDVLESEPVGLVIATFKASDLDQMDLNFSLKLDPQSEGLFTINSTGSIFLQQMLDFEQAQHHEVLVLVTDGEKSSNATLRINVVDFNEFDPKFVGNNMFQIQEEQPSGTTVGTVNATDMDTEQMIRYSLMPLSNFFSIDSASGVIVTSAVLDREVLAEGGTFPNSQTTLTVVATDNGRIPGERSATELITITLVDINDNSPVFDQPSYTWSVNEGLAPGMVQFRIIATDADLGMNGEVEFLIPDQWDLPFAINSSTGVLTVTEILDREKIDSYNFFVIARDNGDDPRSSNVTVSITVNDVNDNKPEFVSENITISLSEAASINLPLFRIQATDNDTGINAEINYRIENTAICQMAATPIPEQCFFSISPTSGLVELVTSLDFESREQHRFVVVATDNGIPTLSSSTTITVNVINVDEVHPVFPNSCNALVPEDVAIGTVVVSCVATDFDEVTGTQSNNIEYSLQNNANGAFAIDQDGNITSQISFDREDTDSYTIIVVARDAAGNPTIQVAIITITDVNDNAPQFIGDPYFVNVTFQSLFAYQQELISISATDFDVGTNGEVSITISKTDINIVDRVTAVELEARDGRDPSLSTFATLTVNFIDGPCQIQSYRVTPVPGAAGNVTVIGEFLCSIDIRPPQLQIATGGTIALSCDVRRNIDATVTYLFFSNANDVSGSLQQGDLSLQFVRQNASSDDSGSYRCRANSVVGGLQTQVEAVVVVEDPATILSGPGDVVAEVGQLVQLDCTANPQQGVSWEWLEEGGTVTGDNTRVFPVENSLLFISAEEQDTGEYTCSVTNLVGNDQASGVLTVFDPTDVVQVVINDHTDPDPNNNCNSFNTSGFQNTMTAITGMNTMSTNVSGELVCAPDPCHPNPCQNGALCNATSSGGYTCDCLVGYTGKNCSEDINECENSLACFNGGTCTNIPGAFSCECPDGVFGDACEFVHENCECPPNYECLEVEGTPSQCISLSAGGLMMVQDPVPQNTAVLDQTINTLNEDQPSNSRRRKRETFVTSCTGKFVRASTSSNSFLLTWICPSGVQAPSDSDLEAFCIFLVSRQLVGSCTTPSGAIIRVPSVNATTVNVFFIMVDSSTGQPLPASDAIIVLRDTDALQKLRDSGHNVAEFKPLVPSPSAESVSSSEEVGGAVGGVIFALVVLLLVGTVVAIVLLKYKRRKRLQTYNDNTMIMSKLNPIVINNNEYEDRYSRPGGLMLPVNDNTYVIPDKRPGSPPQSPVNPYVSYFDDPVYGMPQRPRLTSKHKTESRENLLEDTCLTVEDSGDYEAPPPPERTTSLKMDNENSDDSEPIYGNMGFQWQDKNIGERWQNYQKTHTVLRGVNSVTNK